MTGRKIMGILVLCVLIGFGIVVQAGMTDGQRLYVSQKTADEYKTKIKAVKAAQKDVEKLVVQSENGLSQYKKHGYSRVKPSLSSELEKNKLFAGTEAAMGKGVIITVDDGTGAVKEGQNLNTLLVHDNDILQIINDLKVAGAEAISVNEQRVSAMTAISCAGYTVRINGRTYARPFVIKAIGDSAKLTDMMIGVGGFGVELQEWGVQFQIESNDKLYIPAYSISADEFQYMRESKGERT